MEAPAPCRLSVLLALDAPVAAVLRRGPSNWVQLSAWDTATDQIEHGQWFHGRIYEGMSDLSPDGRLFLYFALKKNRNTVKDQEYTDGWTAISKLPYLTALALWPRRDPFDGGGLFTGQREVLLSHRPDLARPHPDHQPQGLTITAIARAPGIGASFQLQRLLRDGWVEVQTGSHRFDAERREWVTDTPTVWCKRNRAGTHQLIDRFGFLNLSGHGRRWVSEYSLQEVATGEEMSLGSLRWADWDHGDRVVFTRDGALFAVPTGGKEILPSLVADFNDQRRYRMPPPEWAQHW